MAPPEAEAPAPTRCFDPLRLKLDLLRNKSASSASAIASARWTDVRRVKDDGGFWVVIVIDAFAFAVAVALEAGPARADGLVCLPAFALLFMPEVDAPTPTPTSESKCDCVGDERSDQSWDPHVVGIAPVPVPLFPPAYVYSCSVSSSSGSGSVSVSVSVARSESDRRRGALDSVAPGPLESGGEAA